MNPFYTRGNVNYTSNGAKSMLDALIADAELNSELAVAYSEGAISSVGEGIVAALGAAMAIEANLNADVGKVHYALDVGDGPTIDLNSLDANGTEPVYDTSVLIIERGV